MFFGLLFLSLQAVAQQSLPNTSPATDSLPEGRSRLTNSSVSISQQGSSNRVVLVQQGGGSSIQISQQSEPASGAQQIGKQGNQISLTVEAGTQATISQQGPGPQLVDIHHLPAPVGRKARRRSRPPGHK
ncbi:curlin repeat-containing protein [Spirosoma linguale]|uniref:curlin repeat-containing protein n=1 Tax=Spirosoma linguale TaxID=108 RepID=UPI003CC7D13B